MLTLIFFISFSLNRIILLHEAKDMTFNLVQCKKQAQLFTITEFLSFLRYNNLQFSKIMVWKTLKSFIFYFDMFCSTQFLRYKSETQYKTLTGGILSIAIICVIAGGFFNMIGDTLKRTQITSSLTTTRYLEPPLANLIPGKQNMFMVGLSIRSFDLSFMPDVTKGPQFFTVMMNMVEVVNGGKKMFKRTMVPLEPCTKEHWEMTPQFANVFDRLVAKRWVCVPIGFQLPIERTLASPMKKYISMEVYPCNNKTSNNTCASQQQIDKLFQTYQNFYLTLNYINPLISPDQQEPITYNAEVSDYVIFSRNIGSEGWLYLSDYIINTDDSIWPYENKNVKKGYIVEQKATGHPYIIMAPDLPLASIYIGKSPNSLIYQRQVQKISVVFSYIGGLVGAIISFLFLVKQYTDSSLEISIGIDLFQDKSPDNQSSGKFHLISYVRLTFYRLLKLFGWNKKQQYAEQLEHYQQEAVRQLDVSFLLRRMITIQTCIDRLLSPKQLAQICESNPITLKSAKKIHSLLMIQEGQVFDEVRSASEKGENRMKRQQQVTQHQMGKKKGASALIKSLCKRPICINIDQETIRDENYEKQMREPNPIIIQPQGEAFKSSKRNILKRVKMVGMERNGQQSYLEVLSGQQSLDTGVRFQAKI